MHCAFEVRKHTANLVIQNPRHFQHDTNGEHLDLLEVPYGDCPCALLQLGEMSLLYILYTLLKILDWAENAPEFWFVQTS